MEIYKSVYARAQAELTEKKSRFIATVTPVATEAEAIAFIEDMKKKYRDARHNVFAFQVGRDIQRYSDDGEPSGTAGLPVLDVIRGNEVRDVAINVTRYFGGTLLGTGGLVRAYGHVAKEALIASKITLCLPYTTLEISIDYTLSGKIQYEALQNQCFIMETLYTDIVKYILLVPYANVNETVKIITDITGNAAKIDVGDTHYFMMIDGVLTKAHQHI